MSPYAAAALSLCALALFAVVCRRATSVAAIATLGAAVLAAAPTGLSITRDTRAFIAADQRDVGPPGQEFMPPDLVASAKAEIAHGETWAVRTPPISLPPGDIDAIGLIIPSRAIFGEPTVTDADRRNPSAALRRASNRTCGDIRYVGWLAFVLAPRELDCRSPDIVLYWRMEPEAGETLSSGDDWAVVRP